MKKKISVFTLLLSLILAVLVPVSASAATDTTADDVKYKDIEDFMHGAGYLDFIAADGAYYFVFNGSSTLYVLEVLNIYDKKPYCCYAPNINSEFEIYIMGTSDTGCNYYKYHNFDIASAREDFSCQSSGSYSYKSHSITYNTFSVKCVGSYEKYDLTLANLVYSDLDIYSSEQTHKTFTNDVTSLVYESNVLTPYTLEQWCSDAGLNCAASSNETEELYDFTFNPEDYHYIVRRNRIAGSRYTLCLSQVTKEEDLIYYSTNRALADSTIGAAALYVLSGEYASGNTNICNYVYDSSGGGWLYTDNYGVDLGLTNDYFVDDIGISFSSSIPIVYSCTDIYSDKEQSSVYYAADTEFKDPFLLYPIITPTSTPTPTTVPSSGGGRPGSGSRPDSGGQATGGGGLDFIINLFTMIWTKICSIPMAVDGYSISLQQIIVYGALVSIVGGFIMHFIFGRK